MNRGNLFTKIFDSTGRMFVRVFGGVIDLGNLKFKDPPPEIVNFQSNLEYVDDLSQPVILSWEVKHAGRVLLNGEDVTRLPMKAIHLTNDQTFRLEAFSNKYFDENRATLKDEKFITVRTNQEPPEIVFFRSSKNHVIGGDEVELTWSVNRAANLILEGVGPIRGRNSITIRPDRDKTYYLRAIGFNNKEAYATLAITTDKTAPEIIHFDVNKRFLTRKEPITISWRVEGANKVKISSIGEVAPVGEAKFLPREDLTLKLAATSFYGIQSEEEVQIEVSKDAPIIREFISDRAVWDDETPATLKWHVENAETVILEPHGEVLPQSGEKEVLEKDDTIYILRAISLFGVESSSHLNIKINRNPPEIVSFASSKLFILSDQECTLSWKVLRGNRVEVSPVIGVVPNEGKVVVNVSKDTKYEIIATSFFGYKSVGELEIRVLPIPLIKTLLIPQPSISSNFALSITPIKADFLVKDLVASKEVVLQTAVTRLELDFDYITTHIEVAEAEVTILKPKKMLVNISVSSLKGIIHSIIEKFSRNEQR